ncbi:CBS domain-containing protein [Sulfitobacter sp. LCG007]
MLVSQILKSKADESVYTVPPTMMISDVARILSEKRIGTVVISRDGKAADGILSERDIVREIGARGVGCLSEPAEKYMTSKLVTCAAGDKAEEILQKMTDGRFRHIPVLEDGQLVGLISIGDVVKARLAELAMERNALEGMIMGH